MVDTHVHLTMEDFPDREEIVKNFEIDGIEFVIEVGFDPVSSQKGADFSSKHSRVFSSVGIHPHDVKNKDGLEAIEKLLDSKKVVAIGEIGLDYYRDLSPRDLQKKYFEIQLEIAKNKKMPVILHVRDAYNDAYEIVKRFDVKGVLHSFNGQIEDLKNFLDLGFHIGVGGMATYKKNEELRKILSFAPLDRILTETDCPYLSPQPVRGKRNEPKYVRFAIETLCTVFKVSFEEIERITSQNAKNLFNITL
ncbi:TatD family hydrolase [Athalassotoga saccharophila]|uniref:TatD family hydrolase n=1 Tax=Athalassotoga saccharophila TaxID=1441386 RepID=UPI00137AC083|nr:TatD family hydrolase [Athalassotoga saccharophila]BBJ27705.1 D-aminoacyl-tRNA deacylase [Athalassotoga saccharophila]